MKPERPKEVIARFAATRNQELTGAEWSRIETLLASVLDLPPEQRAAFLDATCRTEPGLRAELEALIAASSAPGPVDVPLSRLSELLDDLDAATARPRLAAGDRLGPYVIVAPLGSGGMGHVYRARDARLDREVAIKIVSPRLQQDPVSDQRLEREARIAAALSHPNVLAVYDIGRDDGILYLVTELLTGRTLRDILGSGGLPETRVIDLARQIARGLGAAHARHIVHRDLKPENLFVTDTGVVKILDFGLARPHANSTEAPTALTAEHTVAGTVAYMAPEQITGGPVDVRSDLFALGAVLYEAATGRPAFQGTTRSELVTAVLSSSPDPPEECDISAQLARVIMRCLEKSPGERYQSAADFAFSVDLIAGSGPAHDRTASRRATSRHRMKLWALTIAAPIAVVAVTVGLVLSSGGSGQGSAITFMLHPPSGASFGRATMAPLPMLSPDGRQLAFVANIGSRQLLWVQTLGELEARPLVEATGFPFWSPDGAFIAFGTSQRLQKTAVARSSVAQDICTCDAAWGGSWNRNGTVLFAGADGLRRVPADGGKPVRVTRLDSSRGEFGHWFPVFLRDGRRFLYLVRSERADSRGIHLGSLDDPAMKIRLAGDDSQPVPAAGPDGRDYLFFVRDRVLLAQQFDIARAALVADPFVIAQPVVPGEAGRYAPFSVSGRSLVYRRRTLSRTPLAWVDRRGNRQRSAEAPDGNYDSPAFSPDGTQVAVERNDPKTDKPDIWIIDLARQVTERLTNDPVGAFFPHWTPDGKQVIFGSARGGRWGIYSQAIAGGPPTLLFGRPPSEPYPTAISPDGKYLVAEEGVQRLWLLPLTGGERTTLVDGWLGRVSPDGRWLAYVARHTGEPQTYVTSFPRPGERYRVSVNGGSDPQWRADGRELYYVAADHTLMAVDVSTGTTFRASTATALFRLSPAPDHGGFSALYAPAPGGQRFLVVDSIGSNLESPVGADESLLSVTMNWTLGPR